LSDKIDLRKKKNREVVELLEYLSYDKLEDEYNYLIKLPMDSVTEENVAKILKEKEQTQTELNVLLETPVEKIWLNELNILETEYGKYKTKREKAASKPVASGAKKSSKK